MECAGPTPKFYVKSERPVLPISCFDVVFWKCRRSCVPWSPMCFHAHAHSPKSEMCGSTALAAACPLCFVLSHDLSPSLEDAPHKSARQQTQSAAPEPSAAAARLLKRCGGSTGEVAWRAVAVVVLVVLPLVLPTTAIDSQNTLTFLNVAVLVLCLGCRGSSFLQRPYFVFLVREESMCVSVRECIFSQIPACSQPSPRVSPT